MKDEMKKMVVDQKIESEREKSHIKRIVPTPRRRTSTPTHTPPILTPRRRRLKHNLLPNRDNPLMLQQLCSSRSFHLIALEAASQEVDAGVAELISAG